MTPSELDLHIADCGLLMIAAYNRYEESGCFADRGEADGWRVAMETAIASRGPVVVAAMEQARGLVHGR